MQSGNDACVAMAEYLAGSVDSFANQMNAWAAKLGMTHSHFVNPHGLYDEQHYSTARDMATLGMALIRDLPDQYALHSQRSFTFNNITQHNRNRLLWDQSLSVDGMKTGYVSQVGYNLVASATDPDGMRLISVIMGSSNERIRSDETKKLLTYGFRFFQNVTPYKAGSELVNQTIWMGDKSKIKLGVDENVTVLVKRGQTDNLTADFQLDRELRAPIAKGERVGTLRVRQGDNELTSVALVALEEVNEGSFIRRLLDYITLMITGLFK